jgi:hypothetical protein
MLNAAHRIAAEICPEAYDRKKFIQLVNEQQPGGARSINLESSMHMVQAQAYAKAMRIIEIIYDEMSNIEKETFLAEGSRLLRQHHEQQAPEANENAPVEESGDSGSSGRGDDRPGVEGAGGREQGHEEAQEEVVALSALPNRAK